MNDLENLYNKRFQDKELPNDDFDVDGLWDGVEADLDAGDSENGGYSRNYWPFGILLLLLVGIGTYFYVGMERSEMVASSTITTISTEDAQSNSNTTASSSTNVNTIVGTNGNGIINSASSSNVSIDSSSSLENDLRTNPELKADLGFNGIPGDNEMIVLESVGDATATRTTSVRLNENVNTTSTEKANKTSILNATGKLDEYLVVNRVGEKEMNRGVNKNSQVKDNGPSDSERIDELVVNENVDNTRNSTETVSTKAKNNLELLAKENVVDNNINVKVLTTLDLEATDFLFPELNKFKENEKGKVKKVSTIYPLKKKALVWEIEATAGANRLMGNYFLPTNAGEGTSSEKGEYGSSYGLKVGVVWKKHWTFKTGFEYHQLWSQFNYDLLNGPVVFKDTFALTQVVIDPLTNTTVNRIYVDTMVTSTTGRQVVHHNKYSLYSIPLEFGWQDQKERFLYGLSAGASLNFVRGQKGRRLNGESIVSDFDSASDLTAFKDFGIGLRVTPMLGYRLTSKLSIRITPQLEWYNNLGKSGAVDGVYRFGGGLGLGWRF